MTTPKPNEIWTLKNGKTVRVEYFMTQHYLCTLLNPMEHGSSRCVLPTEFHAKLDQHTVSRFVKKQKIHMETIDEAGPRIPIIKK